MPDRPPHPDRDPADLERAFWTAVWESLLPLPVPRPARPPRRRPVPLPAE